MTTKVSPVDRKRFLPVKVALKEVARQLNGGQQDTAVDLSTLQTLTAEELGHLETCKYASWALAQFANGRANKMQWDWDAAKALSKLAANHPPDSPIRMLFGYVFATHALHKAIGQAGLKDLEQFQKAEVQLREAIDDAAAAYPAASVYALFQAKIASLNDRPRSRELFGQAIAEAPAFMELMGFDQGLHTYFASEEIEPSDYPGEDGRKRVRDALSRRSDVRLNFVWSVDERFLRAYGPYWFHFAPFLARRGFRCIFLVAGPQHEVEAAIEEARALVSRVTAFHGLHDSSTPAVDFVAVPVPDFTAKAKAFFAAARFLYADAIKAETGSPVLTTDADMTLLAPPDQMVAKLSGDFACPVSRGVAVISPWRRYMAGVVFFNTTELAQTIHPILAGYITHGLRVPSSWMLDQNALTYVAEALHNQPHASFYDLSTIERPLRADGNAAMVEGRG